MEKGTESIATRARRGIPDAAGELILFAEREDGRRNVGVRWPGVSIMVEHASDDPEGVAAALARMPGDLAAAECAIATLERELAATRAKVPPARPAQVFDGGCVRQDPANPAQLWLLSKPETGWSAFGVRVESWDELFRRFDVIVDAPEHDGAGMFWRVHPRGARS